MATRFDRPPVPRIQGLNGVGRTQNSPYLGVVIEELDEFLPGIGPQPDDRRIRLAPSLGEIVESCQSCRLGRGRIDRLEIVLERVQMLMTR